MKNEELELLFLLVKSEEWKVKSEKSRWRSGGLLFFFLLDRQPNHKTTKQPNHTLLLTFKLFIIMALLYKIVRDNRKNSGNLYYGRAVQINTIDTAGMADIIQRNCTLKKSDVLAVIAELVDVMTDQLQNSVAVKLDGFGTFKIGLKTVGADKPENFSISRNVSGMRVNFISAGKKDVATNKVTRTFLGGATLQKYDPSKVETTPSEKVEEGAEQV